MRGTIFAILLMTTANLMAQSYGSDCKKGTEETQKGNYSEAARYFEKAVTASSSDSEKAFALASLAYAQQMNGEYAKALENYGRAIEIEKENAALLQQRANLNLYLGHAADAIDDYSAIIRSWPQDCDALLGRAAAYTDKEEFEKAMADYTKLLKLIPGDSRVQLGLISLYQREKRYNEALMLAELLIGENPEKAEYYIARSNIERELGQNELAILDVEKALEIAPGNANYHTLLSILYEKTGKPGIAKEHRRKAESLREKKNH